MPFYNVGAGRSVSILELAHQVAGVCQRLFGKEIPIRLPDDSVSISFDKGMSTNTLDYSTDAFGKLGFTPSVSLNQGIRRLLEDLMKERSA
jgi:nucleoside-diphosphate-sugar epimerase